MHEVISEMLQYVEKIEDCERTLNALPNPGQLIVTGIVKKNALNILMPTAEEESLVKYPSNQYKIDSEAIIYSILLILPYFYISYKNAGYQ